MESLWLSAWKTACKAVKYHTLSAVDSLLAYTRVPSHLASAGALLEEDACLCLCRSFFLPWVFPDFNWIVCTWLPGWEMYCLHQQDVCRLVFFFFFPHLVTSANYLYFSATVASAAISVKCNITLSQVSRAAFVAFAGYPHVTPVFLDFWGFWRWKLAVQFHFNMPGRVL